MDTPTPNTTTLKEIHKFGYDRRFFQVGYTGFDSYDEDKVEAAITNQENPLVKLKDSLKRTYDFCNTHPSVKNAVKTASSSQPPSSVFFNQSDNSRRNGDISRTLRNLPMESPTNADSQTVMDMLKIYKEDDEFLFSGKQFQNTMKDKKYRYVGHHHLPSFERYFLEHHQKDLLNWFELTFSGRKDVKKVITGGYHYFILLDNGDCFAAGWNKFGQLGLGDTMDRVFPTKMKNFLNFLEKESFISKKKITISKIKAGGRHSFILTSDGRLFGFGCSDNGRIGVYPKVGPTVGNLNLPTFDFSVPAPTEIKFFSPDHLNTTLKQEAKPVNTRKTAAEGSHERNSSLTASFSEIILVEEKVTVEKIICGFWHSIISLSNGKVFGFGNGFSSNFQQNLDNLNNINEVSAPLVTEIKELAGMGGIKSGAAGAYHTILIMKNGRIFSCGNNFYGQTGHEGEAIARFTEIPFFTAENKPKKVKCGANHSIVLCENGKVFGFGCSSSKKLGKDTPTLRNPTPFLISDFLPKNVPKFSSMADKKLEKLENSKIKNFEENNYEKIERIYAGSNHCFFKSKTKVFSCGWSRYGQTGQGGSSTVLRELSFFEGKDVDRISCGAFYTIVSTKAYCGKPLNSIQPYKDLFGSTFLKKPENASETEENKKNKSFNFSDVEIICYV